MQNPEDQQAAPFRQIGAAEAKQKLLNEDVTIVDIRDEQSYMAAHIDGAVSVSQQNLDLFLQSADKNRPLLCYCYHGFSSQDAAAYFASCGFKEVYSLVGGFEAWKTSGG